MVMVVCVGGCSVASTRRGAMSLLCLALCAALCIASGFGYDLGPLHGVVDFGTLYPKCELTPEDIRASNKLIGLLEFTRKLMPVGIDHIVPPLDPYVESYLLPADFRRPDSDLKGAVHLSHLVASGAQEYYINKCEVQRNKMRIDIDVTVPHLVADIDYRTANFSYKQFVFNTSGHVQFILKNLRIEGGISFFQLFDDQTNKIVFSPTGFHSDYTAEDVQIDKNIDYIPIEVQDEVKDALLRSVGDDSLGQVAKIMWHFSVEEVIQFLYGDSPQWYYYFESPRNK